MIKNIFLILFLLTSSLFSQMDTRLNDYSNGRTLYQKASVDVDSAFKLGLLYKQKIKDYKEASYWYEKAYDLGSIDAAFNMGLMYEDLNDYNKSITWYKKAVDKNDITAMLNLGFVYEKTGDFKKAKKYYERAYKAENMGGANNLGLLYELKLNDQKNAVLWYHKAIQKNDTQAIGNLAKLYHKQNKNELGAAYLISLIDNGYSKSKVMSYLQDKWKLSKEDIQKAYKLQQTLDIPKHYTGGID